MNRHRGLDSIAMKKITSSDNGIIQTKYKPKFFIPIKILEFLYKLLQFCTNSWIGKNPWISLEILEFSNRNREKKNKITVGNSWIR